MPYSVWKDLSLPELTPTCMTLELADRSITEPIGIAKDVRLMVGKFQFPADFVVVDFEPDPRVPLILGRSLTFNLDQIRDYIRQLRIILTANQIDVIGIGIVLVEEYSQEVLVAIAFIDVDDEQFHRKLMLLTMNLEGEHSYSSSTSPIVNTVTFLLSESIKDYSPESGKNLELLKLKSYLMNLPEGFKGMRKAALIKIPIDLKDQEKITFTCPYGTFAYRRMPFGLCNAPGTFQRCMMAIFHDMIEKTMEVFMDDFSVFGDSFSTCLSHLEKMLKRSGIEVDRAKVEVIAKLPHPTTVKGVRSFLGHAGFYRRFIQDFRKLPVPMTHLLEKEDSIFFSEECMNPLITLKKFDRGSNFDCSRLGLALRTHM
ncbi:reverse transcriptase domain-containing protein [Tanacetum coccineum]